MSRSRRHRQKLPWQIVLIAAVATAFSLAPFVGLIWRTPWSKFTDIVTRREIRDALWLSIETSLITSVICCVFGVPLAWFYHSVTIMKMASRFVTISLKYSQLC